MSSQAEAKLAALLARTVADESLWSALAARSDDEQVRVFLSGTALHLYRRTSPVIEARLDATSPSPLDHAIAAIREVADSAALLSYRWKPEALSGLVLPPRAVIEFAIRADDVDDWAAGLGHPLALTQRDVPDGGWPTQSAHQESELGSGDLASVAATTLATYGELLEARERVGAGIF